MDYDKAQRLIVLATFITLGSTTANLLKKPANQKESLKAHRVIAGGFFAMMICAIITEADTTTGVGLAGLVAGGAFFKYGLPVLEESFQVKPVSQKQAAEEAQRFTQKTPQQTREAGERSAEVRTAYGR